MPPVQTKKYTPEQVNALNAAREQNISQGLKSTAGAGASVEAATSTPINQVSMGSLVRPQEPITVPRPKVATPPSTFVRNLEPSIKAGQDGIIRAQTEEAAKRDDLLGRLLSTEIGSSQDVFDTAFESQGGSKTLRELQDASTKLAQLQGKFRTAGQDISGGQGQSKAFEGVQLDELGREEAIQVGNQALVVQALQGNFDTARQIALDTSNFAIEDRKATLDNLYNQYNAIGTVVANQEAQLIDKERRRLDTLQDSVNSAISSGGASVEEMTQLTSPNTTDDQKLAIAQSIVARTTRQDRELQRAEKFEAMQLRRQAAMDALASGSVEDADKAEVETEAALGTLGVINNLKNAPGLGAAVGAGFKKALGILPGVSGEAVPGTPRADFEANANRLADMFTVQNLDKMTGVLTDKDIEILRNEGTTIGNFSQSEKAWLQELNRLENMMNRGLKEKGITDEQANFYYGISDEDINEVNSLYGISKSTDAIDPASYYN